MNLSTDRPENRIEIDAKDLEMLLREAWAEPTPEPFRMQMFWRPDALQTAVEKYLSKAKSIASKIGAESVSISLAIGPVSISFNFPTRVGYTGQPTVR